jgi:hypothetical protein
MPIDMEIVDWNLKIWRCGNLKICHVLLTRSKCANSTKKQFWN